MIKELQSFGLSEKEAKVYIASLELGTATVQQIAQKSRVNRATTYVQLESLKIRGLVGQKTKGTKSFYVAESPEKVKKIIEREKLEVLFKEKEMEKIMPNLKAIFNVSEAAPKVHFYEGYEQVKLFQTKMNKTISNSINFICPFPDEKSFVENEEMFNKNLKSAKQFKMIYVAPKRILALEDLQKKYSQVKIRYLPLKKMKMNIEIAIKGDYVWINKVVREDMAVVIEDKMIASGFLSMFHFLWQSL